MADSDDSYDKYSSSRKRICGEKEVVTEKVLRTFKTKNITREKIERRTAKCFVLECGHCVEVSGSQKNCRTAFCSECYRDIYRL